jgi:hypothetical protein
LRRFRQLGQSANRLAMAALLQAHSLLGLAAGRHLREARAQEDPLRNLQARLEEAELKAQLAWEALDVVRARLAKIPERHRPYYSPAQRFRIVEIKRLLGWTREETATTFLVCQNTISNWEAAIDPEAGTVGSTVKPVPPVVRFSDAVRSLAQTMRRLGFGSDDLIARTLVRAGWKISCRSIGRIAREKLQPAPVEEPSGPPARPQRPVKAHFVHHVWMMDVSEVRAFLGGTFFQGVFKKALTRLGIVQRFRRKDYVAGTARLESFWRTLKNSARLRLPVFLTLEDLERRLVPALWHYVCFRPHQGLDGATPAEVFLGLEPACQRARRAPRDQPREGDHRVPFRIQMLAPTERLFPVLVPTAA